MTSPIDQAPPHSTHFAIDITAYDKDQKPLARYRLNPAAAKVIQAFMSSPDGAKAIADATAIDNETDAS